MLEEILTSHEMKLCDSFTIDKKGIPSRTLMERAAEAVVSEIINADFNISHVIFLCGSGNNGGDGFAAARFLAQRARERGIDSSIETVFVGEDGKESTECAYQRKKALDSGIAEVSKPNIEGATLIVDAIFGIGLTRNIEGNIASLIKRVNSSKAKVVSVDIPSGINADTGAVMGIAIEADMTVTIARKKIGLLLFPGAEKCGRLIKVDIGIDTEALGGKNSIFSSKRIPFAMPKRSPSSNKGDFGKILIVGGAENMAGAAYLSSLAAYRSGAGLVRIFTTEKNRIILQTLIPEAVLITYSSDDDIPKLLTQYVNDSDAVVIGPGLSKSCAARLMLETVLENVSCPLIIDADALNILSESPDLWELVGKSTVITPHMGEMSRLTGKSISELKENAVKNALDFAKEKGVICCMKDASTVISDGDRVYINKSGCSALSKGGSGDVLTGIIAALSAVKNDIFEASCIGTYIHGRAGTIAAEKLGEYSLLARDIAESIDKAICEHLKKTNFTKSIDRIFKSLYNKSNYL